MLHNTDDLQHQSIHFYLLSEVFYSFWGADKRENNFYSTAWGIQ